MVSERPGYPKYVIDRINRLVLTIKDMYPSVTDIHLIGSYANNCYIDENTPSEFLDAKRKTGLLCKISDFDFETTPFVQAFHVVGDELKIHLGKHTDGKKECLFKYLE